MSLRAASWAWSTAGLTASEKLVLLALAEHHNGATGQCNPSIERLSTLTGCARRTVLASVKVLVERSLIKTRRTGRTAVYDLAISLDVPDDDAQSRGAETAPHETDAKCRFGTSEVQISHAEVQDLHIRGATDIAQPADPATNSSDNRKEPEEGIGSEPKKARAGARDPVAGKSQLPKIESGSTTAPALPPWLDRKAWDDFVRHRDRMRKPLTARAVELSIAKLERLGRTPAERTAILERSVENGWTGLYELKNGSRHRPSAGQATAAALSDWANTI